MSSPGNVFLVAGDRLFGKTVCAKVIVARYHSLGADCVFLSNQEPGSDFYQVRLDHEDLPITPGKIDVAMETAAEAGKPLGLWDVGVPHDNVQDLLSSLAWAARKRERLTLIAVDEAHYYIPNRWSGREPSPDFQLLTKAGRHVPGGGVHLLAATQVPAELDIRYIQAANVIILFHLEHHQNVRWVRDRFRLNWHAPGGREYPVEDVVRELQVGVYLIRDVDRGIVAVERCPLRYEP